MTAGVRQRLETRRWTVAERRARSIRLRVTIAVLAGAAALTAGTGLVAVAAWLIAAAAAHPPVLALMVAVVAVRACGISKGVFRYAERLVSHDVAFRALASARQRLYQHLVRLAPAGLTGWRRGDLLTRLVDDVSAVQDRFTRVIVPAGAATLAGLLATALAAALLPAAGVILAGGLIVAGLLLPWLAAATTGWADRRLAGYRAELAGRIVEALDAADELNVLGAMPQQQERINHTAHQLARAESRLAWAKGHTAGPTLLCLAATVTATLLVAIPALRDGRIAPPVLAVLALLPVAAIDAVGGLASALHERRRVAAALAHTAEVAAAPDAVPERPATPAWTHGTGLVVRGLVACWPGADAEALCGIDLDLPPGKRIAVVGPSGAGKSTLLAVLLGFCPYGGSVHLGGVPLTDLSDEQLRRTVTLAATDAYLFDSTIAANLRLARQDATDAQLERALQRAGLLDWVRQLPHGLDTSVGEHGRRLSGGQRHRLALARALLTETPILLCDEPDASVDRTLADQILTDLLDATDDRSVILVSHRADQLDQVDEVITIHNGRVRGRQRRGNVTGSNIRPVEAPGRA